MRWSTFEPTYNSNYPSNSALRRVLWFQTTENYNPLIQVTLIAAAVSEFTDPPRYVDERCPNWCDIWQESSTRIHLTLLMGSRASPVPISSLCWTAVAAANAPPRSEWRWNEGRRNTDHTGVGGCWGLVRLAASVPGLTHSIELNWKPSVRSTTGCAQPTCEGESSPPSGRSDMCNMTRGVRVFRLPPTRAFRQGWSSRRVFPPTASTCFTRLFKRCNNDAGCPKTWDMNWDVRVFDYLVPELSDGFRVRSFQWQHQFAPRTPLKRYHNDVDCPNMCNLTRGDHLLSTHSGLVVASGLSKDRFNWHSVAPLKSWRLNSPHANSPGSWSLAIPPQESGKDIHPWRLLLWNSERNTFRGIVPTNPACDALCTRQYPRPSVYRSCLSRGSHHRCFQKPDVTRTSHEGDGTAG